MEVFIQDERVGDGDIKEKVKDVLIKLATLGVAIIVPPQLITTINSSHTLVVCDDGFWAGN